MKLIKFNILIAIVLFLIVSCAKPIESGSNIPVFSYTTPIVNPPDEFMILYNNATLGEMFCEITIPDSTVWKIAKVGDGRYNLKMNNYLTSISISASDTLGLAGSKKYRVIVSNTYYNEANSFYVGFTKLDLSYNDFEPKF